MAHPINPQVDITRRVGTDGPRSAKIMVIGMAPAREELAIGKPLVGPSGRMLNNALAAHGVRRDSIFVTNIVHFAINGPLATVPRPILDDELKRLQREVREVNPNIIILLGDEPLRLVTGKASVTKWRGSIVPSLPEYGERKCIGTYHPAFIMRGMWKWHSVFTYVDIARAVKQSSSPRITYPDRRAITGPSFAHALAYLNECERAGAMAFDIETRWWRPDRMGHIACVAFATSSNEAMCVPFLRANGTPYWTLEEESAIWRGIASLLQNRGVKKIAQNASFEWIYFWKHGVYPWPLLIDTMTLHHCLYPDWGTAEDYFRKKKMDEPGHGLAFINSQYTDTPYYKDDGRLWSVALGDHQFWQYNCMDAMVTYDVAMKMMSEAMDEKLWDFYNIQYIEPFASTVRAEWYGTPINLALRDSARTEFGKRATELQFEINRTVGFELNVNSNKQMVNLLYKIKKYPVRHKYASRGRGGAAPTADKDTLRHFADRYRDPLLIKILELRQTRDFISDFIEQPLDDKGYIHTHYKIGGTDGLRWSSSKSILGNGTNLQNLPRDGVARRLFTASDGNQDIT